MNVKTVYLKSTKYAWKGCTKLKQTKSKLTYCAIHCKVSNKPALPNCSYHSPSYSSLFLWAVIQFVELKKASLCFYLLHSFGSMPISINTTTMFLPLFPWRNHRHVTRLYNLVPWAVPSKNMWGLFPPHLFFLEKSPGDEVGDYIYWAGNYCINCIILSISYVVIGWQRNTNKWP